VSKAKWCASYVNAEKEEKEVEDAMQSVGVSGKVNI